MCPHIILMPSPQAPNHRFVSFVIGIIDLWNLPIRFLGVGVFCQTVRRIP
jgi:hypothetical protein